MILALLICADIADITPPVVENLVFDQNNQTIRIKGVRADTIDWIADGEIIKSESFSDGCWSELDLKSVSDKISCYVRFQLKGEGGILMSQPFICDDGDISRFRKPIPKKKSKLLCVWCVNSKALRLKRS